MKWILLLIAALCLVAAIRCWFRAVRRELQEKLEMVRSAESQWNGYREMLSQMSESAYVSHARAVTDRSRDIFLQSAALYNAALLRPANRIPAFFLGYRKVDCAQ